MITDSGMKWKAKEMSTDQGYDIVLKDLEDRQRLCTEEIHRRTEEQKMLGQMISNLRQFISSASQSTPVPQQAPRSVNATEPRPSAAPRAAVYSGMSVRWAILYLLAENATGPMGRSEIAQALTDGGTTSNAQNFSSNVSAILSGMVNQRHEVQQATDGGYEITDHGREVWQGIRRTSQWNARQATPIAS